MKIRSKYIDRLKSKNDLKAFAVVVLLCNLGHNTIRYDISAISRLLKCSYNTAKKRLTYCINNGYVEYNEGYIKCRSVRSRHNERNSVLDDYIHTYTLKGIESGLKIFLITNPIRKKMYVNDMLNKRKKVKNLKELKRIDSNLKRIGINCHKEFIDNGISYDKLSHESRYSKKTTQKYMTQAISHGLITKISNRRHIRIKCGDCSYNGIFMDVNNITYSYVNKGWITLIIQNANRYSMRCAGIY